MNTVKPVVDYPTDFLAWTTILASAGLVMSVLFSSLWSPLDKTETATRSAWASFSRDLAGIGSVDASSFNQQLQRAIDRFERRLEDASPLLRYGLPRLQPMLYRLGAGNESVYLGDDRLIYRPGFDYATGKPFLDPPVLSRRRAGGDAWRPRPQPDPVPALVDFADQVRARGAEAIVLTVPTKVMVPTAAGDQEPAASAVAWHNPSFDEFRQRLEAGGVEVFDATPIVRRVQHEGTQAFLRTDSHWSPAAVDAVANELAVLIDRRLPAVGRRITYIDRSQTVDGIGDLGTLLELPPGSEMLSPERIEIRPVMTADGRLWRAERRAPVLLLGDSFSNVFSLPDLGWGSGGGLAERLAFHLERPVDRLAVNDGSATEVRVRLAAEIASGRDRLAGKQVVIYQLAVRELSQGDWRQVDLDGGVPGGASGW